MSPYQQHEVIKSICEKMADKYNIEFQDSMFKRTPKDLDEIIKICNEKNIPIKEFLAFLIFKIVLFTNAINTLVNTLKEQFIAVLYFSDFFI